MKSGFTFMIAVLAPAALLSGCESENQKYTNAVMPVIVDMQALAMGTTEAASSLKNGQVPDDRTFDRLDAALVAIKGAYNQVMPPPEMATKNGYIVQALASEATAISTLRTLAGRYRDAGTLKSKIAALKADDTIQKEVLQKQLNDLEDQIKGGWTFFNDNHKYFTEYLKTYSTALMRKK